MKRKTFIGAIIFTMGITSSAGIGNAYSIIDSTNHNDSKASVSVSNIRLIDIANHWSKDTVEWGVGNGVVTGYTDGTFRPDNHVTEAEFLAMLIRSYSSNVPVSSDGHWADSYYHVAMSNNYPVDGVVNISNRAIHINRGRVAEIISSTQGVNYSGDYAVQYLLGHGLAKGRVNGENTVESYSPNALLTRAEAVQFIKNLLENGNAEMSPRPVQESDVSLLPPLEKKVEQEVQVADPLVSGRIADITDVSQILPFYNKYKDRKDMKDYGSVDNFKNTWIKAKEIIDGFQVTKDEANQRFIIVIPKYNKDDFFVTLDLKGLQVNNNGKINTVTGEGIRHYSATGTYYANFGELRYDNGEIFTLDISDLNIGGNIMYNLTGYTKNGTYNYVQGSIIESILGN